MEQQFSGLLDTAQKVRVDEIIQRNSDLLDKSIKQNESWVIKWEKEQELFAIVPILKAEFEAHCAQNKIERAEDRLERATRIAEQDKKFDAMITLIEDNNKILTGNGTPREGLVCKVVQIETNQATYLVNQAMIAAGIDAINKRNTEKDKVDATWGVLKSVAIWITVVCTALGSAAGVILLINKLVHLYIGG